MMRTHWLVLLLVAVCASSACAQTSEGVGAPDAQRAADLSHDLRADLGGDALAVRADSLTLAGRPWRATLLLAPALASPSSASPAIRLAGARAAADWSGWTEVDRILHDAPWLDSSFAGEGRELLARSVLERGQPAVDETRRALGAARSRSQSATAGRRVAALA